MLTVARCTHRVARGAWLARAASSTSVPEKVEKIQPKPVPGQLKDDQLQYDSVTHTGQAWDNEDVRLVRFTYHNKQVNPNVAMHLVADVPPIESHSRVVSCDGGGGALGHPKVFMNLDKPGNHACGYCGLRFTLAGQAHNGQHHAGV